METKPNQNVSCNQGIMFVLVHTNTLEKGYLPKFSREIFIVDQCEKNYPITYKIKYE